MQEDIFNPDLLIARGAMKTGVQRCYTMPLSRDLPPDTALGEAYTRYQTEARSEQPLVHSF